MGREKYLELIYYVLEHKSLSFTIIHLKKHIGNQGEKEWFICYSNWQTKALLELWLYAKIIILLSAIKVKLTKIKRLIF